MGSKSSKSKKSIKESSTNTATSATIVLKKPIVTVNQMLYFKSNEVYPGPEYYRNGNTIANEIFNILRNSRKDVDRVVIAGSIGKRTAVGNSSDFDLVIFLNYRRPPFSSILKEIKHILDCNSDELENFKFTHKTSMSISFEICGVKFDLSPAVNFKLKDIPSSQFDGTRNAIAKLSNPLAKGYLYSPGFAEATVEFLRSQTPFFHQIVRLAKHWDSNINAGCRIRGRSLIMELIAVKSCEEVDEADFYQAFRRFLENINNFSKLRIFFHYFYDTKEIPTAILEFDGPIIMDPVNCYNNLANVEAFPASAVSIFTNAAEISLRRMENWTNDPKADDQSFDNIFEPGSKLTSHEPHDDMQPTTSTHD